MKKFNQHRRTVLKSVGAAAAITALGAIPSFAQSKEIRIGYVSPQTGPLAAFGEADKWVISSLQDTCSLRKRVSCCYVYAYSFSACIRLGNHNIQVFGAGGSLRH